MISRIEKFLKDFNLLAENSTLAVGFSGGYDSMALLDILNKLSKTSNFKLLALHLNHNWRGEESEKEAQNCKQFCAQNGIEFYTETLDANEKHTETRARELRYNFFRNSIEKFGISALFTAHTKSDTAETLVYRTIKGTGIKGLQGISPKLGKIYRPMLNISRSEIETYCKTNGLSPNFDSSNNNNNYARNYIRNEILPNFKHINSNYEDALNSLSILAFEEEKIIQEYIKSLNLYEENKIITQKFKSLSKELQKRLIYEIYVKYDFEYSQERVLKTLDFIYQNISSKSGRKCSIDATHWLFVNQKYIDIITQQEKNEQVTKITSEGTYKFGSFEFSIEKCNKTPEIFPKDSEFKAFVEIKGNINFELRTRRYGDRITPMGSTGEMKLKKYFISKSIPQHEKDNIILLCKEGKILWVSGYGLSEELKVVNNCTHVLTLKKID